MLGFLELFLLGDEEVFEGDTGELADVDGFGFVVEFGGEGEDVLGEAFGLSFLECLLCL